jgi:hypothetical protein
VTKRLVYIAIAIACGAAPLGARAADADSIGVITDSVLFVNTTIEAGITWRQTNGADGRKYFPEQNPSGAAFVDYDNDGWEDIIIVQGRHWPDKRTGEAESTMVLYHNNHNGTFTDVTAVVGLAVPLCGMGVSVGDYDNDGWNDLYITAYGFNVLFRNDRGTFHDVTREAGVAGPGGWASSAMWIDYDNDGFLDLFCCYYVKWTPETNVACSLDRHGLSYCTPTIYPGDTNRLFHNNHNGTFTDVSAATHIAQNPCRALGCIMLDYDGDGWMDIMVSNDMTRNQLYHNEHGVTFTDMASMTHVATARNGHCRAGMGIDWADADRDGKPTVVIGNFVQEPDWLYKWDGVSKFNDRAAESGVAAITMKYLSFGVTFLDYDLDGWPDLFGVNGHVQPDVERVHMGIPYRMNSILCRNMADGHFREVGHVYMHGPFDEAIVGRGACFGDYDNDGTADILAVSANDRPLLMHGVRRNSNHFLRVTLRGARSNRNGFGAKLTARVGTMTMEEMMKSGGSFQGSNEQVVTFGLGQAKIVDELVVRWNCGTVDTLRNLPIDRTIEIVEGSGRFRDLLVRR